MTRSIATQNERRGDSASRDVQHTDNLETKVTMTEVPKHQKPEKAEPEEIESTTTDNENAKNEESITVNAPQRPDPTDTDLMTWVCTYLAEGVPPAKEISQKILDEHEYKISYSRVYKYLTKAAQLRWFHMSVPINWSLSDKIKSLYPYLERVEVVNSDMFNPVAGRGAKMIFELLRGFHVAFKDKDGVHIGIAGGHMLNRTCGRLGQTLLEAFNLNSKKAMKELPRELHIHSMVAGFDACEPMTDPNTMMAIIDRDVPLKFNYVALHARGIVESDRYETIRRDTAVKEAFRRKKQLQMIVTGLGSWSDENDTFRKRMSDSKKSMIKLERHGIVGNMMYRPIGPNGPIETETEKRALTLMELSEFPQFIANNGKVVLLCGPCFNGGCRSNVLKTILDQPNLHPEKPSQLVSHVVIDRQTAFELVCMSEG